MGWKPVLEGLSWVVLVPAVVMAVAHPDVGELGLGAFGPPAPTALSRWLMIGGALAAVTALSTRTPRAVILTTAAVLSVGAVTYRHRDVSTRNVTFPGSDITIAATVYEPRTPGTHAAVVLVPGSAPLRRGFYSLWAERLAQSGTVVVVPDKRGVGGTGGTLERNNNSSRANLELLASDVTSALDFTARVATVDTTRLGLFGLSQAGWVAPIAAMRSTRARFLLLVTAPTVSVREEGVWSRMRGDDQRNATYAPEAAEHVMDTASVGGVDARPRLGSLTIPGLWLFAADDNSIPTRKSVAVLDSLRGVGKHFAAVTFPKTGHLLMTRNGRLLPHIAPASWDSIYRWISTTVGRPQ
jgi:dienelactone hydrolase